MSVVYVDWSGGDKTIEEALLDNVEEKSPFDCELGFELITRDKETGEYTLLTAVADGLADGSITPFIVEGKW